MDKDTQIIPGLPFYPADQVHKILNLPKETVHQMLAKGVLPSHKFELDSRGNGDAVNTLTRKEYVMTADIYALVMSPPKAVEPTQMKKHQLAWNKMV